MIKLIACDLDNTLLNAYHELSKEDSDVIKNVINSGVEFMVATGRSYEGAKDLIEVFDIYCDYVVLNGAMIRHRDEGVVLEIPMASGMLRQVIELLEEEDMCYHMFTSKGNATTNVKRVHDEVLLHMMRNNMSKEEALSMIEKGKFGSFDEEIRDVEAYLELSPVVYKVEVFAVDESKQEQVRARLKLISGIEITNSVADNIEITCVEAQKGTTLLKYCDMHGIQKEEVLVFGDSLNDLNMMSSFPNSIAVANATKQILDTANYCTDSNVNHGVAKVLKELLNDLNGMDFLKHFKKDTI